MSSLLDTEALLPRVGFPAKLVPERIGPRAPVRAAGENPGPMSEGKAIIFLRRTDELIRRAESIHHHLMETHVTPNQSRKLFVNLPVRDLQRSIEFFTKLGFTFNPQFTDETGTCMIISEEAYVMLLVEARFKDFTRKQICDTATSTEGLFALSAASRAEVDELVNTAIAAGGTHALDPQDHGFMYGWSFYDLDGHHWEVFYMDPAAIPPQ